MFSDPRNEWAFGAPGAEPMIMRLWSDLTVPWWLTPPPGTMAEIPQLQADQVRPEANESPAAIAELALAEDWTPASEPGPGREALVPPERAEIAYPGTLIDSPDLQPLAEPHPRPQARVHVVQPGQSIWQIARMYGVDMSTLIRINRMRAPYTLYPGQMVRLPSRLI